MSTRTTEPTRVHVIYERPADRPENFVVRGWTGDVPDPGALVFPTLRMARNHCKALGLVCFNKDPASDAAIKEVWAPIRTEWPFGLKQGELFDGTASDAGAGT